MIKMESIKDTLRDNLPPGIFQSLRVGRDVLFRFFDLPSLLFHPWRKDSNRRLREFYGKYAGKRCFVIGNGPSLKHTDLSLLKNEYTFGMNRVYLAFEEWGFQTSFLVSINNLVIEQCRDDFQTLSLPKFFSWRSRKLLFPKGQPDQNTHFLDTTYTGQKFADSLAARFWEGATVTYVCLQLAFCMGFKEIYLIGVDHNFETKGAANKIVVSSGDDPNHFSPEYFGKGFRWQLPDLDTSEIAYRMANQVYLSRGRQVFDATVGGKLEVFQKVDYSSLFP
jgi:hypothetical protein